MTPACWYCRGPGLLLCDFVIGDKQVSPTCSTEGCESPATVIVGAGPQFAVCEACSTGPEHRRKRTRVPFNPAAKQPVTCDASACRACAQRYGWKTVMSAIVCTRSGRGRGCHDASLHRCHAHAGADPEAAPVGKALRAVCEALAAGAGPGVVHRDIKPDWRVAWRENQALLTAELREGRRWAEWTADELRARGLRVELAEAQERERLAVAVPVGDGVSGLFARSDHELALYGTAVGDLVLEVKSRTVYFSDASSYPYPTALVDTVDGWEAKQVEPRAVLLVSRPARRILVVSAATRPRWTVKRARDMARDRVADFYECPKSLLASFEWLVAKLLP